MSSHLGMMVLFAGCVGVVFGTLGGDDVRSDARLALRIFGALVLGGYALGWIMLAVFR